MVEDQLIEVFRGEPETARSVQALLSQRQIRSLVRRHESHHSDDFATVVVYPETEHQATAAVESWREQQQYRVRTLSRRIRNIFLVSLCVPAAWLAAYSLSPNALPAPQPSSLFVTWLIALLLVARIENQRDSERVKMPAA